MQFHYECLDTLIQNLNNCFEQDAILLLIDAEDLFAYSLHDSENLNACEWEQKLKSPGVSHFSDDVSMSRLK